MKYTTVFFAAAMLFCGVVLSAADAAPAAAASQTSIVNKTFGKGKEFPVIQSGNKTIYFSQTPWGQFFPDRFEFTLKIDDQKVFRFGFAGSAGKGEKWGNPFGNLPKGEHVTYEVDPNGKMITLYRPYNVGDKIEKFKVVFRILDNDVVEVDWNENRKCCYPFTLMNYENAGLKLDGQELAGKNAEDLVKTPFKLTRFKVIELYSADPAKAVTITLPGGKWSNDIVEKGYKQKQGFRKEIHGMYGEYSVKKIRIDLRGTPAAAPVK